MKLSLLTVFASLALSSAWAPTSRPRAFSRTALRMALDYNDPAVGEELAKVQMMMYEEVQEELLESGIRTPGDMNDMDIKLMLVEVRLRKAGGLNGGAAKKTKPATFSSKFEELLWTKPAFKEFYEKLEAKGDHNSQNVVKEYINDPATATQRYQKTYKGLLIDCDLAIKAPPPVKSPTLEFSGFPANMGDVGLKMTLESLGAIVDFECQQDDDFPSK